MCGIFASFSKERLAKLAELNSYRGSKAFSISHYDPSGMGVVDVYRSEGTFNVDVAVEGSGRVILDEFFKICHVQAPTSGADASASIHPAQSMVEARTLWHNGIIKASDVERLQAKWETNQKWDTKLLMQELEDEGYTSDNLSEINGSFACVYVRDDKLFVFRNEISPLFFNDDMDFSSVKFPGSMSVPPNIVFRVDLLSQPPALTQVNYFTTKETPYYFGDDIPGTQNEPAEAALAHSDVLSDFSRQAISTMSAPPPPAPPPARVIREGVRIERPTPPPSRLIREDTVIARPSVFSHDYETPTASHPMPLSFFARVKRAFNILFNGE